MADAKESLQSRTDERDSETTQELLAREIQEYRRTWRDRVAFVLEVCFVFLLVSALAAAHFRHASLVPISAFGLLSTALWLFVSAISRHWKSALLAGIGFLVFFALPSSLPVCCASNPELSAIRWLREINSAQAAYSSSCGGGGYATDLADLAKPPREGGIAFIPSDLATNGVTKDGYIIALGRNGATGVTDIGSPAETCNGAQSASSYYAVATPIVAEGRRYFATDASGTIFQSYARIPNPIPSNAAPAQ